MLIIKDVLKREVYESQIRSSRKHKGKEGLRWKIRGKEALNCVIMRL